MVKTLVRMAFIIAAIAMVCLGLALTGTILLYKSEWVNVLLAYLIPRYYRLVWGMFASVIVSAFLATKLDTAHRRGKPLYVIAADWTRGSWAWLTLHSPLSLRLPIIAFLMAAFIFFIPPQNDARITFASPDAHLSIAGSPQLIVESRGAGVPGFSRWRRGDQVFYVRSSGFGLGVISLKTGEILWQGSLTHETADGPLLFSEALAGVPEDIVTVVVAHGFSSSFLSEEFHGLLRQMGCSVKENPGWDGAYILVSARRDGHFSPAAELWGEHAVLALDPNPVMRVYFLFRRVLPEINITALVAILVLLVAAFARGNHGTDWPRALRIGLIGGPTLGSGVLWLVHSSPLLIVSASFAILAGTYLLYREAFLNRRKTIFKTVVLAIVLVGLSYPDFLARNYALVRLLVLSLALYLAWRTYSLLFGGSRLVSYSLFVFFATRVPLALVAYVSRLYAKGPPETVWHLARHWDAGYYVDIASDGYHLSQSGWSTANFFPLLPFLTAVFRMLSMDLHCAGFIVSNLAFLVSLSLLYHLVNGKWGEESARRSVFLMAAGPASFFFSAIYTESLFLLCCVAFFILMLDKRWFLAGLAGTLAALTRSVGLVLVVVATWEYLRQAKFRPSKVCLNAAWVLLIPLGCGLFSFVLYGSTGDMFANLTAQRAWGTVSLHSPFTSLRNVFLGLDLNLASHDLWPLQLNFVNGVCILASFLVLVSVYPIARQLGGSYAIFTALGILLPLSTGTANSALRYAQVLFPITVLLGLISAKRSIYLAILTGFLVLTTFLTILFVNDFWVV